MLFMATIKFLIKDSKSDKASIYLFLSIGRGQQYETSTKFEIKPSNWTMESHLAKTRKFGFPKNISDLEIKNLRSDLKRLESHVLSSYNKSLGSDTRINSKWLRNEIKSCFNRIDKSDTDKEKELFEQNKLTYQIQYIIENASIQNLNNGKMGLSKNRIKGYITLKNTIINYQKERKTIIYLKDIDVNFEDDFKNWLLNEQFYSYNYSGKVIDNIKAVCNNSIRRNVEVSNYAQHIKPFKMSEKLRRVNILDFDDLAKIINYKTDNERLNNIRKHIVLGCYTGLRYSDLVRLNANHIREIKNVGRVFDIVTEKTNKNVVIPIQPEVEEILKEGLPYELSDQKLNEGIKELCKLIGITETVEGYKMIEIDLKVNGKKETVFRSQLGKYPKNEVLTVHDLRRSFASNFYRKISTPILMTMTGHTRESTFYYYIGEQKDKDHNAKIMFEQLRDIKKEITPIKKLKASF